MPPPTLSPIADLAQDADVPACVLVFNAGDPSGAGGITGDVLAIASVGSHAMPITTGAYARDTSEIFDHFALDAQAVAEQARAILEDAPVQSIKIGFVGSPESLGVIAGICADYADVPVIAYMPDLSWWDEVQTDLYLDAFSELVLPQTTILVGNHRTLCRWLLPEWGSERTASARDLAKAASDYGVGYTLVTGIVLPDQFIDNVLASAHSVISSERLERFEAVFTGAGDTLSAAFAALLPTSEDLVEAFSEALSYLDRCLSGGFRPGMGHVVPDRLFWAQPGDESDLAAPDGTLLNSGTIAPHDLKH